LIREGLGVLGLGLMHLKKNSWFQASDAWLRRAAFFLSLLTLTMRSSSGSFSSSVPAQKIEFTPYD
jgi:hypothetical protein